VSLWFYTYLIQDLSQSQIPSKKWKRIMWQDQDIRKWYNKFVFFCRQFYLNRMEIMKEKLGDLYEDISGPTPKNVTIDSFRYKKGKIKSLRF